jgi:hypothetical protein
MHNVHCQLLIFTSLWDLVEMEMEIQYTLSFVPVLLFI